MERCFLKLVFLFLGADKRYRPVLKERDEQINSVDMDHVVCYGANERAQSLNECILYGNEAGVA